MKSLVALFLALVSVVTFAATPNNLRPHRRVSTPRNTEIVVPWKTVAAGGAAAGTVVAAYKVSDGVEEGIKIVAKEKPEVFADTLSILTWPIRLGMLGLFFLIYYWIWRVLIRRSSTSTPKGFRK